ncbi:MAG: response regulator [Lachnospiraceae bacterium]|jgi:two-component system response regulator YesN|nr:response regulator [Lachnospiraceae bacterium]
MNRKLRILIVEDEEIERKVLEMMLKYNRQDIEELRFAENGIEALSIFQEKIPDIVLMDINLPGINGLETIRQMQLIHSGVRFVILSAYNLFSYAQEAIRLNVFDFLIKPIQLEEIQKIISRLSMEIQQQEESLKTYTKQTEKLKTIRPLLESDCIYSIASMHSNTSITTIFDFLQMPISSGYVFIAKGEGSTIHFIQEIKRRMRYMTMECLGDMINELCVFVALSDTVLRKNQIREMLQHIIETLGNAGSSIHIGVGSISEPNDDLKLSYNQALSAVQHAEQQNKRLMFYDEIIEITENAKEYDIRAAASSVANWVMAGDTARIVTQVNEMFSFMQVSLKHREIVSKAYWFYALVCSGLSNLDTQTVFLEPNRILEYNDIPALKELLISNLTALADIRMNQNGPKSSQIAEAAITLVHRRYMENITLESVAKELNFSPYYLSRIFKKSTEYTFSEYLTNYRIEKAKEFLSKGTMSIKEIAYATGFNSQGYFAKIFKKYTGNSPSEYTERTNEETREN